MTDTSSLAITHATTDPYPVSAPLGSPVANGAISDSAAPDEEEPYTIKCICSFDEDDGSTVFCEGCETWQHIVCYYPDKRVPDVHNCVDCEPRQLDSRRAAERQRQRRIKEKSEDGDRRKRSGAKTQRKKGKEGDVNGSGHQRSDSSAREQPPAKKTKTSHRSSASISALPGIPALTSDTRKRRSSTSIAPSPTKSSTPPIPLYSNEFLHLYDRDDEYVDMDSNLFVNVNLVGDTASWVKDPEALAHVTNGRRAEDTFNWSDAALDRSHWPALEISTVSNPNQEIEGRYPTWKMVKTQDAVRKDEIVGEITGKVGNFDDYCRDPNNRWQQLRHPEPFVFFSSVLPLYIDSRHEGSVLRYARRSCRPNVTMKIFITNEVEYHFCFVAKEDIPANSEITTMWYLDAQLFESSNGLVKQESGDSTAEAAAICMSNTLANFGGCACGLTQGCLLANLDRRRVMKFPGSSAKQPNGKRKKVKAKSGQSPLDNGRASVSRAGSETLKHPEDDDAADTRSTSGSAREQPQSRDMSPNVLTGTELSSREKRKIADAEKQFQQLEQDQRGPGQRKKKRASGPSAQSPAATASATTQTGYFGSQRGSGKALHLDTAGGPSRSPTTALSPGFFPAGRHASPRKTSGSNTPLNSSPLTRATYVDASVQADVDEAEPSTPTTSPAQSRSGFLPMSMRLFKRFSVERLRSEDTARQQLSSAGSDSVAAAGSSSPAMARSPSTVHDKSDVVMADANHSQKHPPPLGDVEMKDVAGGAQADAMQAGQDWSRPPFSPPWPSTAAHRTRLPGSITTDMDKLRVSMPPPSLPSLPPAISPASASTPTLASPTTLDTTSHAIVPPSGPAAPTPIPAKKKLSLGDYLNRRSTMVTTPTSEKSQAQTTGASSGQKSPSTPSSGPAASAEDGQTPIKASPDAKPESLGSPDVTMKDAPEATQTQIPSVSS